MDRDLKNGATRFVSLARPYLPLGVGMPWLQQCVSALDAVGGPQDAAAYVSVMRSLRRLAGWGYRTKWLESCSAGPFLKEVYRYGGWAQSKQLGIPGESVALEPQFARPGYARIFGPWSRYERMREIVVLMTLLVSHDGPDGRSLTQSQLDELVSSAADNEPRRGAWTYTLRGVTSLAFPAHSIRHNPASTCSKWARVAEGDTSGLPANTRETLRTVVTLWRSLLDQAPATTGSVSRTSHKTDVRPQPSSRRKPIYQSLRQIDDTVLFALPRAERSAPEGESDIPDPEDHVDVPLELVSPDDLRTEILAELEPTTGDDDEGGRRRIGDDQIRAYITLRRRDRADWILCPSRPNALLAIEAAVVNAAVLREADKAASASNMAVLGASVQLLLVAMGALSTQEIRQLRVAALTCALAQGNATFVTPEGYLVRSVPMPTQRYRPPAGTEGLEPVTQRLALRMPREVHTPLAAWIAHHHPDLDSGSSRLFPPRSIPATTLSRLDDKIRARTHLQRFTTARLTNTLPLTVMEQTHDNAVVQMVTGNTHGLSATECAYFSPTMAMLQGAFDQAVEAMGFTRAPLDDHLRVQRVGSQLCIADDWIRNFARRLGSGLSYLASAMTKHDARQLAVNHNRMVLYTGWLLQACLMTRSCRTIGELSLTDVALDPGWLIVGDKRIDVAHAARLVVVSPLAVAQLRAFASHLDVLSHDSRMALSIRREMKAALAGGRPLLFFVDNDAPSAWNRETSCRGSAGWPWPSNALRHRGATSLRQYGCPGDFVAAQLGHVELGHLLGFDSPTSPRRFHGVVSKAVDAAAKADGWAIKKGYGQGTWTEQMRIPRLGKINRELGELTRREQQYLHGRCPSGAPKDPDERAAATKAIEDSLVASLQQGSDPNGAALLSRQSTHDLRVAIAKRCHGDRARTEWELGVLHRLMMRGEEEKRWSCEDKRKVLRTLIEPSPVVVGMLEAYRAYQAVHAWYVHTMPAQVAPPTSAPLLHWLALSLILDHFVSNHDDLLAILDAVGSVKKMAAHHNQLMASLAPNTTGKSHIYFLQGRAALLAARCRARKADSPQTVTREALETWLRTTLPQNLQPRNDPRLPWLLAIARIASRLEMSGLLRALGEHTLTPTSLTAKQMTRLFDQRPPETPKVIPRFDEVSPEGPGNSATNVEADAKMEAATQSLRSVLALLNPNEYRLVHGVDADKEAMRQHRIERATQLAATCPGGHTAGLLVEYAIHLLTHGTARKKHPADSTIYMYVNDVAIALTKLGERMPLTGWSTLPAGALTHIYHAAIAKETNVRLSDYLRYFHEFLMASHGLPPASFDQLPADASRRTTGVEADLVTRREHLSALKLLERAINQHADDSLLRWQLKAASVAMILMYHAGLRMGGVVSRLYSDLCAINAQFVLHVHDTDFGTLKTSNAYRVVAMGDTLAEDERSVLTAWLHDARIPNKTKHPEALSPLFPASPHHEIPIARQVLENIISRVLRIVIDTPNAHPHWLRHAAASRTFLSAMRAATEATDGSDHTEPLRRSDIVKLKALLGHASISTTFASYIHTDALVQRCAPSWINDYVDADLAHLAGIKPDHLRRKRADLVRRGRAPDELIAFILGMRRFQSMCAEADHDDAPLASTPASPPIPTRAQSVPVANEPEVKSEICCK